MLDILERTKPCVVDYKNSNFGGVDFYPKNLESGKNTFENGDITYCKAHHNMAIFYAQTDYPILSVDVIPVGKVTSDLAVFDRQPGKYHFPTGGIKP